MTIAPLTRQPGWPALFWQAFTQSRNAMVLLDADRRHVEVNGAYLQLVGRPRSELIGLPVYSLFADGPTASESDWRVALTQKQFTGVSDMLCAGAQRLRVEFAGHPEVVTGRQLVLCVILRTTRARERRLKMSHPPPSSGALSARELDVVELIAMGLTGPEIGQELQLAHNTVRSHVRNAMEKIGARSRAELVARTLVEIWPARVPTRSGDPEAQNGDHTVSNPVG